ncbi:DNA-binding response regulator [Desertihabitans brevis]|uniref:DNA-binding response regulator n=1 Tax=Desertihabitans brevis TaxID=2268447 RepID=A0A367YSI6_9ACTN|nr:response regulator transcription factor [Desertihabitans brevis]RCK68843.1 DNA-binding response regulator [Desertihabitans brevis]
MSADAVVRVLLVDDDPLVRAGLRMMLAGDARVVVVGEAEDGDELGRAVAEHRPDVALVDVRMPRLNGVAAVAELRRRPGPRAPAVIMLTTFDADETVLSALRAGADGYLLKHAPPEQIVDAVHRAAAGEPVFSASVLRTLIRHSTADADAPDERWASLGERERQVAEAVARGLSNAEIAAELYLSLGTVKAEVSALLETLGVANRIQLAILAARQRRP